MSVIKNSLLAGVSVLTIGSSAYAMSSIANAQTANGDTIIDKLATRFNLNKDDVKAVFDEQRAENMEERKAELSDRLQSAVDDGKITAEQKTLIENKLDELQTAREAEREALETWAEQNAVDVKYLMGGRGMHSDSSERLQNAVDDGKITAEQKTLIENKREELDSARQAARDELKQWADDNNIELRYIIGGGMGMHGRGHGMRDDF